MALSSRTPRVAFAVSYGAEDYFLDRDIEKARNWAGREAQLIDGEDIDEGELISCIEAINFEQPRTLILDNAQKVKLSKAMKGWLEERSKTDTATILVAVVRSDKLPAGWAGVAEKGEKHEAKKFPVWAVDDITRWIEGEAARRNVTLGPDVAKTLMLWVDVDLYRLSNEIGKLAIFVGAGGKVTREHLELVVSKTPQTTQFAVAESTIAKRPAEAINRFSILYKNEGAECLVPTTNALMRQVERALIVRASLDRGVDAAIVAASVGLDANKYPYRQLAEAAKRHTSRDLKKHMSRLCKLDVDVKGAASSKRTLVELAVLAIAS